MTLGISWWPGQLEIGDFNADGLIDLAVLGAGPVGSVDVTSRLAILWNRDAWQFEPKYYDIRTVLGELATQHSMKSAVLRGDDRSRLVLGGNPVRTVRFSNSEMMDVSTSIAAVDTSRFWLADTTGDGGLSIIFVRDETLNTCNGFADGTFSQCKPSGQIAKFRDGSYLAAHVKGDDAMDLISPALEGTEGKRWTFDVFRNNGGGGLTNTSRLTLDAPVPWALPILGCFSAGSDFSVLFVPEGSEPNPEIPSFPLIFPGSGHCDQPGSVSVLGGAWFYGDGADFNRDGNIDVLMGGLEHRSVQDANEIDHLQFGSTERSTA